MFVFVYVFFFFFGGGGGALWLGRPAEILPKGAKSPKAPCAVSTPPKSITKPKGVICCERALRILSQGTFFCASCCAVFQVLLASGLQMAAASLPDTFVPSSLWLVFTRE